MVFFFLGILKIRINKFLYKAIFIDMVTLSTCFTLFRCALVPFIIMGVRAQAWFFSALLFFVAEITDVLDGRLARMRNEVTKLGAFLDTVADKCMMLSIYSTLYSYSMIDALIPGWFLWTIVGKEIIQALGFLFLIVTRPGSTAIEVSTFAKIGGLLQGVLVLWVFLVPGSIRAFPCIVTFLMGLILLVSLLSLVQYAVMGYCRYKR